MEEKISLSPLNPPIPSFNDEHSSQLKRKKKPNPPSLIKTPKVSISLAVKDKKKHAPASEVYIYNKNVFLFISCGIRKKQLLRAHFVKSFFNKEEIEKLHQVLEQRNYWEPREDCRGSRLTTIMGQWTARGRNRMGADPIHPAGKGGLAEQTSDGELNLILEKMGRKVTNLVLRKRGDIDATLREYGQMENGFGIFHLFMAPRGYSDMHNDRNDYISVCVGIQTPKKGGALEVGGIGKAFNIMEGDVLVMDTNELWHGSMSNTGREDSEISSPEDRIVGIFILWKKFLRIKG
jgi:hypothetical protein